jgi:hypothetical protein
VRLIESTAQGGGERWHAVVVNDERTGEPLFRVRSAMVDYGYQASFSIRPGPAQRWLADGSGFVARVSGPGPAARHAIIPLDGSLEELPSPPEALNEGGDRYVHGFVPSPDNSDQISWSGIALYRRSRGEWLLLNVAEDTGGSFLYPWLGDGRAMLFGFSAVSFGSGFTSLEQGIFLDTVVEYPPFTDTLRFVAAGPGPSSLWSGLGSNRELVAEVAAGTVLDLFEHPPGALGQDRRAIGMHLSEQYISVQMEEGLTGWVVAAGLRWAM